MSSGRPICLYAGSAASPNVARLLSNLHYMLECRYEVDIVASRADTLDLDVPSTDVVDYRVSTVRAGMNALDDYAEIRNPAVLVQVTEPPIHGTVVGAVARWQDVPGVYRYSGDRFCEYRVVRGVERWKAFMIGSMLGRVPLQLADEYIALGPTGLRRLVARGVRTEDITTMPPAIDPTPFEQAEPAELDVPADRKIVLFVGRLSRLKGKGTLETAIPTVLKCRDDLHFVCVGSAEEGLDLPPKYYDHVTPVGRVAPRVIPKYMRAADILVHPSLTDGIPRVTQEALAAGTPVLARDVGDVAAVTDNTFHTDTEFIEQLCSLEELPTDDIRPFTRDVLGPRYREYFSRFM